MKRPSMPEKTRRLKNTSANEAKIKKEIVFASDSAVTAKVKCPDWLADGAREEWERVAPELIKNKLLTQLDIAAFAAYCQTYAKWKQVEIQLNKTGLVVHDIKTGGAKVKKINPLFTASTQLLVQLNIYGAKFGLSAADRTRVDAPFQTMGEDNEFDIFLRSK